MIGRVSIRMLVAGLSAGLWSVAAVADQMDGALAVAHSAGTWLDFQVGLDAHLPTARGGLLNETSAISRAVADYDTALELAPGNLAALSGPARAADFDRAIMPAPGDARIATERSALIAARADTLGSSLVYDPAGLMNEEFRVLEGAPNAPRQLVIVHAGNALAREAAQLPRSAIVPALDAGALGVTHLFTYTGQDSAIWANLALICAGTEGFGPVYEALATPEANTALDAIDLGGGRDAFDEIVARAYAAAGLSAEARACATDRARAVRYLADWSDKRGTEAWRGPSIYDQWPVYVLDGAVVTPDTLIAALALIAPVEEPEALDATEAANAGDTHGTEGAVLPPEADATVEAPSATELPSDTGETAVETEPIVADEPEPAASNMPAPGLGDPDLRVPIATMGVWSSSLTGCITYTDAIAEPTALDAALPALNPLDGPALGTILLTAQQALLFNTTGTRCYLAELSDGSDEAPWQARLDCVNAIAPDVATPLSLTHAEADGPTARLTARFGTGDEVTLLQCRPIGALGRMFAPLWRIDTADCMAEVPLRDARARFAPDAGDTLALTLVSTGGMPEGSTVQFSAALDGVPLASGASSPDDGGLRVSIGDFETVAGQLATGFLLDLRITDDTSGTESYLLPLLGSGRAMAALAACSKD